MLSAIRCVTGRNSGFSGLCFALCLTKHGVRTLVCRLRFGRMLEKRWDAFPLHDLAQMVSERIGTAIALPSFVDCSDVEDADDLRTEWQRIATERPADLIADVSDVDADPNQAMATYRLGTRQLVVNSNHPFVREHGATAEEKELVRDLALIDFLVETRMITLGIDGSALEESYQYRDQVMRVLARLGRRTGAQIAQLLEESTGHSRGLEVVVGEALDYLGFVVTPIGGRGETGRCGESRIDAPSR